MKLGFALVVALLTLFMMNAVANAAPGARGGGGAGFVAGSSLTGGLGTASNKTKSIPACSLAYGELSLNAGFSFGTLVPLLQASYRYVGQTTKADSVGGINMAGSGYLLGAGLGFDFSSFAVSVVYDLMGQYDLQKDSSGGDKVAYTSPAGFHFGVSYRWFGSWEVVANASLVDFKKRKSGSTESDVSGNPLNQTLYGLGLGYRF